jgi:hypothetical protein
MKLDEPVWITSESFLSLQDGDSTGRIIIHSPSTCILGEADPGIVRYLPLACFSS